MRRALVAADGCGLLLAFAATHLLIGSPDSSGSVQRLTIGGEIALFGLTLPLWIVLAKIYGLYDRDEERPVHTTVDDLTGVFHLVTVGVWAIAAASWLTGLATPDLGRLIFFWATAVSAVVIARSAARVIVRRTRAYRQRTLIVGSDHLAQLIAEKLHQRPESGIEVVGWVADPAAGPFDGIPLVGPPSEVSTLVSQLDIERVIVTQRDDREASAIIRSLRASDVQIDFVPRPIEMIGPGGTVHMLDGVPILGLSPVRLSRSSMLLKRAMDVVFSSIALALLTPVLALIALRIKLDSPGPALYRHDRIGQGGRPFRLLKFRTMHTKYCRGTEYGGRSAEQEFERLMEVPSVRAEFERNHKLQCDPRVTRFGAFLRRTSLDELPQLVNVLRGNLSLVGPRPIVADELSRYGTDSEIFLALRPGVTGYWQISGRSNTGYAERVRLDIAYASNWSLGLDLSILLHTLRMMVASPRGAY